MTELPDNLCEMDVEAFLNMREWLINALEAKGALITDTGIGMGEADVGIKLLGMPYSISIKPRSIK